jgi:hypothetical protein
MIVRVCPESPGGAVVNSQGREPLDHARTEKRIL